MPNPICATISGMLEGTGHLAALQTINFENIVDRANGINTKETPILPTDNKALAFDTAAVVGKAGDVQKLFLLVSTVNLDIQIDGGVIQTLRVPKPVFLLTGGPEVSSLQLIGVPGSAEGKIFVTKIVGAP